MIFAPDDVGDFHLDVINNVDEVKNPGAVRSADRHVRMRLFVRPIEIDLPAVMPREQPVEKRGTRSADVQITGRRGGEANADVRAHLARGYTHFERCCSGGCASRRVLGTSASTSHSKKIFPARRRACRFSGRFTFAIRVYSSASERTRSIASNPTSATFCVRSHFKSARR